MSFKGSRIFACVVPVIGVEDPYRYFHYWFKPINTNFSVT